MRACTLVFVCVFVCVCVCMMPGAVFMEISPTVRWHQSQMVGGEGMLWAKDTYFCLCESFFRQAVCNSHTESVYVHAHVHLL